MKFEVGQLIGNYFTDFDNEEQLISSHVIIEVLPEILRLYCIHCHPFNGAIDRATDPYTHHGIEYIQSQDESQNNFYWRIQNEA
jgi:hypothetical protein